MTAALLSPLRDGLAIAPRTTHRERFMHHSVVLCTPEIAFSTGMLDYIHSQTLASKKQWVYEILAGTREAEAVIHADDEFVIVPDIDCNTCDTANWLLIFRDTSLSSLCDLRGHHVELLQRAKQCAVELMQTLLGFAEYQVMCYFHYLPSVFQLHLHVCTPYGQYTTADILKVHALDCVTSNLCIDSAYYEKVTITTVIIGKGELANIYDTVRG